MKKIGNKFIIGVIFIIAFIVTSQVYIAYSQSNRDTNSYLSLISGNGTLNEMRLTTQDRKILASGDKVRVIGESSLAVIEWGDGSMTRLGGNTNISIQQNEISRDFTNINISFELIAGKTWSNIVSFIGSDSSFTQTFDGIEAGVRGTVFDVDLDNQFIHTSDHSVEITTPQGEKFILPEGRALSLESFSLIQLSEYIKDFQDAAWTDINKKLDKEYIEKLKFNLESSIRFSNPFLRLMGFISPKYAILYVLDTYENQNEVDSYISSMPDDKKIAVYNDVFSLYQEMNFISPDDLEYERKMRYKKALVTLNVDELNSQRLVVTAGYDLQDMLESGNKQGIKDTVSFIQDNVQGMNPENLSLLKGGLEYIPVGLSEEFSESLDSLGEILNIDFSKVKNINSGTIGNVLDSADGAIKEFLDDNVGGLLEQFSN